MSGVGGEWEKWGRSRREGREESSQERESRVVSYRSRLGHAGAPPDRAALPSFISLRPSPATTLLLLAPLSPPPPSTLPGTRLELMTSALFFNSCPLETAWIPPIFSAEQYERQGRSQDLVSGGAPPISGGARPPIFRLRPQITRVPPYVLLATPGFRGGPGPPRPPPPGYALDERRGFACVGGD